MDDEVRIEDFLTTKKQKTFEYDFFKKDEKYEKWEDVDFDGVYEGEKTFEIGLPEQSVEGDYTLTLGPDGALYVADSALGSFLLRPGGEIAHRGDGR